MIIYFQKAMKLSFNKKLAVLFLIFAFFCSGFSAYAEVSSSEEFLKEVKKSISEASLSDCQGKLVPAYDEETKKFLTFLETNFQNKSSTTSLSNLAIAAYTEYKKTLRSFFYSLAPKSSETQTDVFTSYKKCSEVTETYLKLAKERMLMHIRNNSAQKKTTVLLEKFQAIGERLRTLNYAVAEFYSLFLTFKNKLPGFLKECVTQ